VTRATLYPIGAAATLAELESDPHPLLARLRAAEPVSWLPALGGWLVTRRDLALQAMRDDGAFTVDDPRFATARVVGPSMLSLDGAEHGRHRAPFARPFRLAAVRERFTQPVDGEVDGRIDAFADRGSAELRRDLAGPLAAAIVMRALGLASADTAAVLRWYDAIVASTSGQAAGDEPTAAGRDAFAALSAALEDAIDAGDSLLATAAGADTGGLTRAQVVSNAAVLMFGGIETTEGMIANALLLLLRHPPELERVRADRALVAGAIDESLRLEPAAATIDRYATRDVELGGARIAAGDLVTISIAGANRDPDVFPDPDRFDPARPNAKLHLAFAHGPHVCIGMHLARLEAHTAVARVLDRLPNLELDGDPRPRGIVFRKPAELRVRFSEPKAAAAPAAS
jgi:cytochrome P450